MDDKEGSGEGELTNPYDIADPDYLGSNKGYKPLPPKEAAPDDSPLGRLFKIFKPKTKQS